MIGAIFYVKWDISLFNALVWGDPKFRIAKSSLGIIECEVYFAILHRLWVTHECKITDRQTDGQTFR